MNYRRETKIAIIDNSLNSSIYNPVRHWKPYLKVTREAFRAKENNFPDLRKEYTHLILTGSEASILERERWAYEEIDLIHEAMDKEISILGSCYGHQLLAVALAGPQHVQRCADPEIGWISLEIKKQNELLDKKKKVFSFSSHFDEVVNLGDEFSVFASSDRCLIQAFQLKNKRVWGLQIHPEISIPEGQAFLKNLILQEYQTQALFEKALNSTPRDSGLIHLIVKNFLSPNETT